MSNFKEVDSSLIGHYHCIANEVGGKRECNSSDALAVYINEPEEGEEYFTSYCYSCNQAFSQEQTHNSSVGEELGCEGGVVKNKVEFVRKPKAERITRKEVEEVLSYGYKGKGIRNLKDEWSKFFGHTTKLDSMGNPIARYYPETQGGKLVGYKCRNFPKDFRYGKVGITGSSCDLSGQVKFKDIEFKDILLVGGEECKVAAMQMWMEYKRSRYGEDADIYNPMPIVSPTVGETGCLKQIQNNYDFINRAERIFLGFDNDEYGIKAMQEIAEIFPKEKVFIVKWSKKDPDEYLWNKEDKDYSKLFISDFYNAKPYASMGIITSKEADSLIEEELLRPKMSLPPFMKDLQSKMAGGIPLGYIVNWIAETGK
ncbi:Topoisomerase-primase domain [Vibrio phage vB_VpaM_R16F]|nr:Topoisomerase-primase domain [Vibrio phage vB_VpaM_R16F]